MKSRKCSAKQNQYKKEKISSIHNQNQKEKIYTNWIFSFVVQTSYGHYSFHEMKYQNLYTDPKEHLIHSNAN